LSLLSAKKAIERESGDQNGNVAFSVPGTGCAASEPRGLTQSADRPCVSRAVNATLRPSGDSTSIASDTFSGIASDERMSGRGSGARRTKP
jgi:hypothetical protein